jgi:hypothetical protein
VLREGDERFPHALSLSDLHELVHRRVTRVFPDGARPELRSLQQTRGRVELVRLFPNRAARAAQGRRPAEAARETEGRPLKRRFVQPELARYEIRSVLARSPRGGVYECWDTRLARKVAIKTVSLADVSGSDSGEIRALPH